MKTYNEMANDVLRRIKENNEIKAKKRKMYVRYATSFASILIIAVLGISVWYNLKPAIVSDCEVTSESGIVNDLISNNQSSTESENEVQNSVIIDDEDIIWAELQDAMEMGIVEWNGKKISVSLYEAFNNNEGSRLFAIAANYNYVDKEYMYNGKSLGEYESEMHKEQELIGKLEGLLKDGDYLKYGKDLYLIGAPDGEKWAKEWYDKQVSMYGEDVLNTYIQNGEFFRAKLESDLKNLLKEESQLQYERALDEYISSVNMNLKEKLEDKNIVSDFSLEVDYLLIYVTEAEFEKMQMENQSDWMFYLASKTSDEPQDMDDVE